MFKLNLCFKKYEKGNVPFPPKVFWDLYDKKKRLSCKVFLSYLASVLKWVVNSTLLNVWGNKTSEMHALKVSLIYTRSVYLVPRKGVTWRQVCCELHLSHPSYIAPCVTIFWKKLKPQPISELFLIGLGDKWSEDLDFCEPCYNEMFHSSSVIPFATLIIKTLFPTSLLRA